MFLLAVVPGRVVRLWRRVRVARESDPTLCLLPRRQASHHLTLARGVLLNEADPAEFEAWTKIDVDSLNLLASYNNMLGNHAAAEESAREAFSAAGRHAAQTNGKPAPSTEGLKALTSLREALTMMCRVDEAREIGWKALDHAEGVHGDVHLAVAAALSELVELAISETRIDDIFEDHKAGRISWRTAADALALRQEDTRELCVGSILPPSPGYPIRSTLCLSTSLRGTSAAALPFALLSPPYCLGLTAAMLSSLAGLRRPLSWRYAVLTSTSRSTVPNPCSP